MRYTSALFAIVLGTSMDAAGEGTHRVQLNLGAAGSFGGVLHAPLKLIASPDSVARVSYTWQRWSVSPWAGAVLFLRPLQDDDTPPSLQPFLQRTPEFWAQGTVSWWGQDFSTSQQDRYEQFGATLGASGYVTRWLWLTASTGATTLTSESVRSYPPSFFVSHRWTVPLSAGVGARLRDVLIRLDYSNKIEWWALIGNPYKVLDPVKGDVRLSVRAVLQRRVDLNAYAELVDQVTGTAGGIGLFAQYFVRPRTGPFAGFEYWTTDPGSGSSMELHEVRARAGITHWWTGRLGLTVLLLSDWSGRPHFPLPDANGSHMFDWIDGLLAAELYARW